MGLFKKRPRQEIEKKEKPTRDSVVPDRWQALIPVLDDDTREWVSEAWRDGGVLAWVSLRDEIMAFADESETLLTTGDLEIGTDLFLLMLHDAPNDDRAYGQVALIAAEAVNRELKTPLERRLHFRHSVIAVGFLRGDPAKGQEYADIMEEGLIDLD